MLESAVFLDRDGVLIEDVHLLVDPQNIQIYEGVPRALAKLAATGYKRIVISNQPVIARGLASEQDVRDINSSMEAQLVGAGAPPFDAFYFCPHHPNADVAEYRVACDCRKPEPGMFNQAAKEHSINLSTSFMIGDRVTDVIAGHRAGCQTILVETGKHKAPAIETPQPLNTAVKPDFTCPDLGSAVGWILSSR